jgi:O-acetyl-ADP-ribose deacetylase (regulator of RNase III)
MDSTSTLELPSVTTAEMEEYDINQEVLQQAVLQNAAQAREEAVAHVDRGNVEAAIQLLQNTRAQILNNPDLAGMSSEADSINDLAEQLKKRNFIYHHKLAKYQSHEIALGKLSHIIGNLYGGGPEQGNITSQNVDAIVNSADYNFQSHGPLSQDILRAAGPQLQEELKKIGDCSYGEARITGGYNLPAKYVIHTVAPPWNGGQNGEEAILAQCYRNSLDLAIKNGVRTIAFPALGTGILGYSPKQAAKIAFLETNRYLYRIGEIKFVCNNQTILKAYEKVYNKVGIASKVLKTLKK